MEDQAMKAARLPLRKMILVGWCSPLEKNIKKGDQWKYILKQIWRTDRGVTCFIQFSSLLPRKESFNMDRNIELGAICNIDNVINAICRRKNLYYHFLLVLVFHSFVLGVYFLVFH